MPSSTRELLENLDRNLVCSWFENASRGHTPHFYNSVDIRNSGFKLAPVDTNIFPAGFNLLSTEAKERAISQVRTFFSNHCEGKLVVGLIAENFSRNTNYWENIKALKAIIESAGKQVIIGVDDPEVLAASIQDLNLNLLAKKNGRLFFGDNSPCLVIANRDFTGGEPEVLKTIEQQVFPPVQMGWYNRTKTAHFDAYNKLAQSFASEFDFDPWLISTYHSNCGEVNFAERNGLDCVARNVDITLTKIQRKYDEYGISEKPYVFVKANRGTFGMGIMTVSSGEQVLEINKKVRNKMSSIKEGVATNEVIIQEGVLTIDSVDGKSAEPFVYLVNGIPIGAILRINENKDQYGNLNSSGMSFEPINCKQVAENCEFSAIGIIARLAAMASVVEKI